MTAYTAKPIQKIIISSDPLRPMPNAAGVPACDLAAGWLHHILAPVLRMISDLPVEIVIWNRGFKTNEFYNALKQPPDISSWADVHYRKELPESALSLVQEAYGSSVVIANELPDSLIHALTSLGIPVFDTIGWPIRFLDDHLNAWRTNVTTAAPALEAFRLTEDEIAIKAGLIQAKMSWVKRGTIPENSALILGQVSSDKALINRANGEMLNFGHYIEELFDVAARHTHVFYKPHPYDNGLGPSGSIIGRFRSFEKMTSNFYWLLCQPEITSVYAISSGGIHETKYFGKSGHYFYQNLYINNEQPLLDMSENIPVAQAWLTPSFWQQLLRHVIEVKEISHSPTAYQPNLIRRTLNADWGYSEIDALIYNPQ